VELPVFGKSHKIRFTDSEVIDTTVHKPTLEPIPPMFEKYFSIVNDSWGVEQNEFVKRLGDKDEDSIVQAIKYTKDRISAGKATNPAGVFLDALSKGYKTPEQIKAGKQEEKARLARERAEKIKPLIDDYEGLEKNYSQSINDSIRSITKKHPEATEIAIEKIKTTYRRLGMADIMDKTTEDFRQNPMLRNIVMSEIMNQYPSVFDAIKDDFEQKKTLLKQKVKLIDPNYVFKK
jgi:hypothetical protein